MTTEAQTRLAGTGRNEPCPCGSGKKYKKCHLQADEAATVVAPAAPGAQELLANGWRLFEQRRPGAAEKEFKAALALQPDLADAQVGVGMARLSAGDNDGARAHLEAVVKAAEPMAADLRKTGVTDAFTRKEAQPYIRASHALGCLAYDKARYADAVVDLERVYAIDAGTVGTEARLIAAKSLIKQGLAWQAVPVLEAATKSESAGRTHMGLALAHFAAGDPAAAKKSLAAALGSNPHFAKVILGVRRQADGMGGAPAGSREEALMYAQTYGDVWDQKAKEFLAGALAERANEHKAEIHAAAGS